MLSVEVDGVRKQASEALAMSEEAGHLSIFLCFGGFFKASGSQLRCTA